MTEVFFLPGGGPSWSKAENLVRCLRSIGNHGRESNGGTLRFSSSLVQISPQRLDWMPQEFHEGGLPRWWSEDTVALVTGANKGIGYEFVRAFATEGLSVVLTARDPAKGEAAADELKKTGLKNIYFHKLEIGSPESVKTLATWVKGKFGGLDILVNNAGVVSGSAPGLDGLKVTYKNAKEVVDTNYFGVKNVTEGLLPILRASPAGARIINVSSRAGLYEQLKGPLLETFRDEDNYSEALADSLAEKYFEDVKAGTYVEEGWISEGNSKLLRYSESKLFLNVFAIALAKSLAASQPEGHEIYLASMCPGVTQTALYDRGAGVEGFVARPDLKMKTPAEGADTGLWLALLPKEEIAPKVGKFYGEDRVPLWMEEPTLRLK